MLHQLVPLSGFPRGISRSRAGRGSNLCGGWQPDHVCRGRWRGVSGGRPHRPHIGVSTAQKVSHMLQIDRPKPDSSVQPAPPCGFYGQNELISRALLLMERNLACTVPISEIASSLETSTRQLERLFKESIGCAPQVAYRRIRLKHARWMLRSGLSLTSIAADTGFSDGAHFGKAFKAMYGVNPSEERRRIAQKVDGLTETARVGVEAIRVFDTAVERP